ncbi:hypothetical protein M6C35_002009 [Vibrio metschnikovii]|nr:hypothetical protein [Vibrio metschnikovii]
MSLSSISELESSFLLHLSNTDLVEIRREPFTLACGDILQVFDTFTFIGSSTSAGNQPIKLSDHWVQRYQGILRAKSSHFQWLPSCWDGQDLVLFDAFNSEDIKEGFVSPGYRAKWKGTHCVNDGYFIAYLKHCDDQLFHTRGGSSSSVCKCTSLVRWPDKTQKIA